MQIYISQGKSCPFLILMLEKINVTEYELGMSMCWWGLQRKLLIYLSDASQIVLSPFLSLKSKICRNYLLLLQNIVWPSQCVLKKCKQVSLYFLYVRMHTLICLWYCFIVKFNPDTLVCYLEYNGNNSCWVLNQISIYSHKVTS